jgi:DNA-binding NarL/FixJ family response regulator
MRILIIEDEIIIGRYIQQLIAEHFDCETRLSINIQEAKSEILDFLPHLVLSDIHLNDTSDGIELIRHLQERAHFETIFITSFQAKNMIEKASATLPAHYIVKPIDEKQVVAAIELTRNRLLSNPLAGTPRLNIKELLSKSEYDVLQLIGDNKTTKDIAQILFLSPLTVKNHRHNISRKLRLPSDNNALTKWVLDNKKEVNF